MSDSRNTICRTLSGVPLKYSQHLTLNPFNGALPPNCSNVQIEINSIGAAEDVSVYSVLNFILGVEGDLVSAQQHIHIHPNDQEITYSDEPGYIKKLYDVVNKAVIQFTHAYYIREEERQTSIYIRIRSDMDAGLSETQALEALQSVLNQLARTNLRKLYLQKYLDQVS